MTVSFLLLGKLPIQCTKADHKKGHKNAIFSNENSSLTVHQILPTDTGFKGNNTFS